MKLKRNDKILLIVILAACLLYGAYALLHTKEPGQQVEVLLDGVVYGTYALNEPQEVLITGPAGQTNLLVIKDGYASVTEASCPDKLCVHQKSIRAKGEMIVCLPNKMVVQVLNGEVPQVDAVAN